MINFVAQIRIEVNNLWQNSQEKSPSSPPALRHFPQSCAGVFLCMEAPCKVLQAISLKSINARKEVVAS